MQNDYRSADRLSNLCDYALHTNMLSVVTQYIKFDKFNSANGHGRSMSLTAVHNCRAHATLTFWLLVRKCKKKKLVKHEKPTDYIYIYSLCMESRPSLQELGTRPTDQSFVFCCLEGWTWSKKYENKKIIMKIVEAAFLINSQCRVEPHDVRSMSSEKSVNGKLRKINRTHQINNQQAVSPKSHDQMINLYRKQNENDRWSSTNYKRKWLSNNSSINSRINNNFEFGHSSINQWLKSDCSHYSLKFQ